MDESEVARALRNFADDERLAPRAVEFRSLASEIEDDEFDEPSWVDIDLVRVFDPGPATGLRDRRTWIERTLGILAAITVFAPVAWTWWSFSQASSAYRQVIDDGGEVGATFLSLWAAGFDGQLAAHHRLVEMSRISLSLIVGAISLIFVHRLLTNHNERREEEASDASRVRLLHALADAQRVLNTRRVSDPKHIEALVKSSVRSLQRAHSATKATADHMADMSDQTAKTLTASLTEFETTMTSLIASLQALINDHGTASTTLRQATISLGSTVAAAHQGVAEVIAEVQHETSGQRSSLTAAAAALNGAASSLGGQMANSNGALAQAVADMRAVVDSLETSLDRNASAMAGQTSELTSARDAAERMLRQLEARLVAPSVTEESTAPAADGLPAVPVA